MRYFAGLDVSLEETTVCVVDDGGLIVREGNEDRLDPCNPNQRGL
jgi:hypothetical protein